MPPQQDQVQVVLQGLVGELVGVEAADRGVVEATMADVPLGQPAARRPPDSPGWPDQYSSGDRFHTSGQPVRTTATSPGRTSGCDLLQQRRP